MKYPLIGASLVIASLGMLLTGCASTVAETAEAPRLRAPTPAASSEPANAWAGVVAEQQVALQAWSDGWADTSCSAAAVAGAECRAMFQTGAEVSESIALAIEWASLSDSETYLGEIPADIADLYGETIAVTGTAKLAGDAWRTSDCNTDGSAAECIGLATDVERAMDDVRSKFAAWSPYL